MSTSSLCRLSQLHEGETATVDHLNLSGPIRRRLHDLGPVSYTHLDVYKRQPFLSTAVSKGPLPGEGSHPCLSAPLSACDGRSLSDSLLSRCYWTCSLRFYAIYSGCFLG